MKKNNPKLTLDQPATYQITVPGVLDALWIDEDSMLNITTGENSLGQPTSTITGKMDQAALHGHMRRLYGMGLPLISVFWIDEL
jgi:hypothetical protein